MRSGGWGRDYQAGTDCRPGILMVIMGSLMVYLPQLIKPIICPYRHSHRGKLMELFQCSHFICLTEGTPENEIGKIGKSRVNSQGSDNRANSVQLGTKCNHKKRERGASLPITNSLSFAMKQVAGKAHTHTLYRCSAVISRSLRCVLVFQITPEICGTRLQIEISLQLPSV